MTWSSISGHGHVCRCGSHRADLECRRGDGDVVAERRNAAGETTLTGRSCRWTRSRRSKGLEMVATRDRTEPSDLVVLSLTHTPAPPSAPPRPRTTCSAPPNREVSTTSCTSLSPRSSFLTTGTNLFMVSKTPTPTPLTPPTAIWIQVVGCSARGGRDDDHVRVDDPLPGGYCSPQAEVDEPSSS